MTVVFEGGCLCGAVRYQSSAEPLVCAHCRCIDCRKTSGTGHGSHVAIPADAFTVTGEVKFFASPADSGNIVSRGFCPTCGSAIYSANREMAKSGWGVVRSLSSSSRYVFQPECGQEYVSCTAAG